MFDKIQLQCYCEEERFASVANSQFAALVYLCACVPNRNRLSLTDRLS